MLGRACRAHSCTTGAPRPRLTATRAAVGAARCAHAITARTLTTPASSPLRILFCGSDSFSATALRRLDEERRQDPRFIASLNVVCRTGKPSGRGLRAVRESPLKAVATSLGLPVHEIATFTGWSPPVEQPLSLVIAVSFGLKVPRRILDMTPYGGLNLHPSLLPALRGPAPLQHTILQDLDHSGVTLQTLHPTEFDAGVVLAQRRVDLNGSNKASVAELSDFMAPIAADLLIKSLRAGIFVPPARRGPLEQDSIQSSWAPKISPEDAHIDWQTWTADRILRSQRALGTLWNVCPAVSKTDPKPLRVQLHDLQVCKSVAPENMTGRMNAQPGVPTIVIADNGDTVGGIWSSDGIFLTPEAMTIAGGRRKSPVGGLEVVLKLRELGQVECAPHEIRASRALQ